MRTDRAVQTHTESRSIRPPRHALWPALLTLLALPAGAGDPRDVVFDCPCRAEWTAGPAGQPGELTLTFAVRSFRATESGALRLARTDLQRLEHPPPAGQPESAAPSLEGVPARTASARRQRTMAFPRPPSGEPLGVSLWERVGTAPAAVDDAHAWRRAETLALWPVSDTRADRIEFVDILTDTDGDGVGDVNERLAGTSASDPADTPGASTIDVLALYDPAFGAIQDDYPYTRIQHAMAVTRAVYRDSGTHVHMRMVGASEVEPDLFGNPAPHEVEASMERHGADLHVYFQAGGLFGLLSGPPGDATLGGALLRGAWRGDRIDTAVCAASGSALCAAHQLGHNLGLAHSARQGEAHGAFRWSRGRYVSEFWGTVMSYGQGVRGGVFSDPAVDCGGVPCGVPIDQPAGADAVRSLDLMRFQAAAHRASKPDADGDGIVDLADAFPQDPVDWLDLDGDGSGDVADPDADGDGVLDEDDRFPFDPTEWEDRDGDGLGDNADADVVDIAPFRDPVLRAAVERALGKASGAPITETDLSGLTTLEATVALPGEGIRDLTGLELAGNLAALELIFNQVSDLSPLSGLDRLAVLRLTGNEVADLGPLRGLPRLQELWLTFNPLADLSPLAELPGLSALHLGGHGHVISDPAPLGELTNLVRLSADGVGITDLALLSGLTRLTSLWIPNNPVTDLSPLPDLHLLSLDLSGTSVTLDDVATLPRSRDLSYLRIGGLGIDDLSALAEFRELWSLALQDNRVTDLSPLRGLSGLRSLDLRNNRVSDVGPLSNLGGLGDLDLAGNRISDVSPLRGLSALWNLDLDDNDLADIGPLRGLSDLVFLWLENNRISDLGPVGGLPSLEFLDLSGNDVSDVSPLAGLSGVRSILLTDNDVTDIGPLVRRELWSLDDGGAFLFVDGNPLDDTSLNEHIPTLESWGVSVIGPSPFGSLFGEAVAIADPVLHGLVAQAVARDFDYVDGPVTTRSIGRLTRLHAFNAAVTNLSGLEAATGLTALFLGSNLVSDVSPLAALRTLRSVDLSRNLVSDIAPLVDNRSLGSGDWITLTGNPLSEESLNVHVPALRDRGVHVGVDSVRLLVSPDTRGTVFDVSGYFDATAGPGADLAVTRHAPDAVQAELVDGVLRVSLGAVEGPTTVNVTATAGDGTTETLAFKVSVRQVLALFPSAATPAYQGFARVTNHSPKPGRAVIHATDDAGRRAGPVTLSLGAHATAPFNSQDLEHGNASKGLSDGVGAGTGDWRLDFGSNLDIEVLGYARTADGFVTTLHEIAPRAADDRTLPFLNPGSNTAQVSRLRLVNPGAETAEVTVTGVDDQGRSPGSAVEFSVAPGTARTLTAADLEAGPGATGALGDGSGKWRLRVASPAPLYAISLLESPTGHLTNLSSGPVPAADGTHTVPLFPAAGDPDGRQGFVRVVNREDHAGTVTITAIDDAGRNHGSVTLAVGANATAPFNSDDLEQGSPAKGLTGSVGAGTGNWRLALTADVEIDVLGYIRHTDGFITSMHDTAPVVDTRHRVAFFNPGSNRDQVSSLRLINPGDRSASVTITGRDDGGKSPGGAVRLTIPGGAARSHTAEQLEAGGTGLRGALGNGAGKWRLVVESSEPIVAMSVLASPTGHLTNLSTAPMR